MTVSILNSTAAEIRNPAASSTAISTPARMPRRTRRRRASPGVRGRGGRFFLRFFRAFPLFPGGGPPACGPGRAKRCLRGVGGACPRSGRTHPGAASAPPPVPAERASAALPAEAYGARPAAGAVVPRPVPGNAAAGRIFPPGRGPAGPRCEAAAAPECPRCFRRPARFPAPAAGPAAPYSRTEPQDGPGNRRHAGGRPCRFVIIVHDSPARGLARLPGHIRIVCIHGPLRRLAARLRFVFWINGFLRRRAACQNAPLLSRQRLCGPAPHAAGALFVSPAPAAARPCGCGPAGPSPPARSFLLS